MKLLGQTIFFVMIFASCLIVYDFANAKVKKVSSSVTVEKKGSDQNSNSGLETVLNKYSKASQINIQFEKNVESDFSKPKTYKGNMLLAKKKLKIENISPEKSTIVFDGESLWNIQYPNEDVGGKIQVGHKKVSNNLDEDALLQLLLDPSSFKNNFAVSNFENQNTGTVFDLKALNKNSKLNKTKIFVSEGEIKSLSFEDELGSKTKIQFLKTTFLSKLNKKEFKFVAPKNAQIIEL